MRERNGVLKTVYFDHEDDNVIQEALTGDFSRVFLELPVIPELTRQRLCGMRDKVVLLQHDLTDFGLTCLDAASPENMGLLVDHLHMLGHRKIALLNTQPLNEVITGRIEVFRRRSAELGLEHQFFNAPVNTFERADHKAYELAGGIIRRNCFSGTGIVTTTIEAAIGTLRAVHDNGMRPGKEISVCAYGGLESARLSIPSITVICATDIERQCRNLLCDILDRRTPERLLYSWEKMSIWQGESSGPVLPR